MDVVEDIEPDTALCTVVSYKDILGREERDVLPR